MNYKIHKITKKHHWYHTVLFRTSVWYQVFLVFPVFLMFPVIPVFLMFPVFPVFPVFLMFLVVLVFPYVSVYFAKLFNKECCELLLTLPGMCVACVCHVRSMCACA